MKTARPIVPKSGFTLARLTIAEVVFTLRDILLLLDLVVGHATHTTILGRSYLTRRRLLTWSALELAILFKRHAD